MKTLRTILLLSVCLSASSFAQIAFVDLAPGKMEGHGLSFSVAAAPQTTQTLFTVGISAKILRNVPATYYATLGTSPEPPLLQSKVVNGKTVETRLKTGNEKGEPIAPSSVTTNQTNTIVYTFMVPNDKLPDARFMFWTPGAQIKEVCRRITLKQFTGKQ